MDKGPIKIQVGCKHLWHSLATFWDTEERSNKKHKTFWACTEGCGWYMFGNVVLKPVEIKYNEDGTTYYETPGSIDSLVGP